MTKPIVSLAAMMMVEEGRLLLSEPLSKYIPAFAETKVGVEKDGALDLVDLKRPITIQDLMRHTSGISYGFTGVTKVHKAYHAAASVCAATFPPRAIAKSSRGCPCARSLAKLGNTATRPTCWAGCLKLSKATSLGALLKEKIFDPLGMVDTAFYTPPEKLERRAEAFSMQTFKTLGIDFMNATSPPAFEPGGGGLLSTLPDYARFCALLLGEGRWNGVQLLSPRLFRYMVRNHLPRECSRSHFLLSPGYGFGLGFAVREDEGVASAPGTVGEFNWGGAAGTAFWVAPADDMFAILMLQTADYSDTIRPLFRNLVYAALS